MKKKIIYIVIAVFFLLLGLFLVPVNNEEVWINDHELYDIGHYEIYHYNVFGFVIKKERK